MALLVVKRGPTKTVKKFLSTDWQALLDRTWLAHLEAAHSVVLEKSIIHGVSCARSCCSSRTFMAEVRKRK